MKIAGIMRTPQSNDPRVADPMDDCDDIFGPPRTYPMAYPPRNRPSMISAKYKQKEERRKVLKISLSKLKKIDDPEANLCRSVLINNTMKRLQKETREEKSLKQQQQQQQQQQHQLMSYPRCYSNDSYLNIKTEFLKSGDINTFTSDEKIEDIVIENDFHARLEEEINHVSATSGYSQEVSQKGTTDNDGATSKKRAFEELLVDECDMHDVLSQFYMPPTPRMLTAMDEDEDVNVVDDDPLVKRLKLEENHHQNHHHHHSSHNEQTTSLLSHHATSFSTDYTSFINNNNNNIPASIRFSESDSSSSFSCGQASMFGEMQTNVYHHSLITSLET